MSDLPTDTTPEAWQVQTSVWRKMGGVRRLLTALQLSDEVRWALLRRQLGDGDFRKVFPSAPLLEP
jgi:hypothetical protein